MTPTPPATDYWLGLMRRILACGVTVYGHAGDFVGYSSWSAVTADTRRSLTVSIAWGNSVPDTLDALLETALCPQANGRPGAGGAPGGPPADQFDDTPGGD